jgi:hypothetical protein
MSKGPQAFKKRDLVRALAAVTAAGLGVGKIEIGPDGKIVIVPGKPEEPSSPAGSSWDDAMAKK